MADAACRTCSTPTADPAAVLCLACVADLAADLALARRLDLPHELDVALARQARIGSTTAGRSTLPPRRSL